MRRKRVRTGRKPRLSLAVAIAIVDSLRWGGSLEAAARAAGVDVATARRWLVKGRAGVQPYVEFSGIVDEIRQHQRSARPGAARAMEWQ